MTIERLRSGATWRTYLVCPKCEQLCERLFLPPPDPYSETEPEWACRECHGLVYASQRYGRRHPIRLMGAPRTLRKRILSTLTPIWYDDSPRGSKRDRLRESALGVDMSAFRRLNQRFEYNCYGIPIGRIG